MSTKKAETKQPDVLAEAAASVVANTAPADPKVDAATELDVGFLNHDRSEVSQHLERCGWSAEQQQALLSANDVRWCNSSPDGLMSARYRGWEPVEPAVMRGDLQLCRMPKDEHARRLQAKRRHAEMRRLGSFQKFDEEAARVNERYPGHFQTIEGDESPRAGM